MVSIVGADGTYVADEGEAWNRGGGQARWSPREAMEVTELSCSSKGVSERPGSWSGDEGKRETGCRKQWKNGGAVSVRGFEGVLGGPGVSESYMADVRTPAKPLSLFKFAEKACLDKSTDQYMSALDGYKGIRTTRSGRLPMVKCPL